MKKQKLVVGKWNEDVPRTFVPCEEQPEEPITEVTAMVSWAEKQFEGIPGRYDFIREIPGYLICFEQLVMDFVEEAQ